MKLFSVHWTAETMIDHKFKDNFGVDWWRWPTVWSTKHSQAVILAQTDRKRQSVRRRHGSLYLCLCHTLSLQKVPPRQLIWHVSPWTNPLGTKRILRDRRDVSRVNVALSARKCLLYKALGSDAHRHTYTQARSRDQSHRAVTGVSGETCDMLTELKCSLTQKHMQRTAEPLSLSLSPCATTSVYI